MLLSVNWQVIKSELSLEFPEFEVVGLIVLARMLLEIWVVRAACLHQPKAGALCIAEVLCHWLCPGCLSLTSAGPA